MVILESEETLIQGKGKSPEIVRDEEKTGHNLI